jgi:hypothetical protein
MGEQRRIPSNRPWLISLMITLTLLRLTSCGGPLPGSPKARTILPASDVDRVDVLPDGRRIIFWPTDATLGLMMLDISTGERVHISKGIYEARWLDDELLYGEGPTYTSTTEFAYYAINLRPLGVVRLEALAAGAASLPERIKEADSIYVVVTASLGSLGEEYLLLLLRLDADRRAVGGYAVYNVRNPDTLLAGHPYKTVPSKYPFPYGSSEEKHPSPDGNYYYICGHWYVGERLLVYSRQGELLNSATTSSSGLILTCYGWAWDSSGVFFQETGSGPPIGERRIGPLQLLEVKP